MNRFIDTFKARALSQISVFALLILLALTPVASEASFGKISSVTGTPSLMGESNSYVAELVTPSQGTLTLVATAAASTAGNTGTRIKWSVLKDPGTVGTASIVSPPGGVSQLSTTENQSSCTLSFSNISVTDKFTVTAQIEDNSSVLVGANAVVKVSFKAQVNLTGLTLNRTKLTVRNNGKSAYLRAIASPTNATGVTYTWTSKSPATVELTQMTPASPDVALIRGLYPGYSSTVQVQASSHGSAPFTATCEVTVADKGEVADDMAVPSARGTAEEGQYMRLYAVDAGFVKDSYALEGAKIKALSGVPGAVSYILTSADISPMPMINNDRAGIMSALGEANYNTTTAAATRVDINFAPPMAKGDMVPFVLAFSLDNLVMPDGKTTIKGPISQQTFTSAFRLIKYFENSSKRYSIDLSKVLLAKSPTGYTKMTNGRVQITPLVVLVDAPAPESGCDVRVGAANEYGVKYDKASELLFIYDGSSDTKISDPMVLEYRSPHIGGGGGGGGCNAGFAGVALLAVLVTAALRRR